MKKVIAVATLFLGLIGSGVASAHQVGDRYDYYWKAGRAESKLMARFDLISVSCEGYGKPLKSGFYRHLMCEVETDEEYIDVAVHVTGMNTYRITFP